MVPESVYELPVDFEWEPRAVLDYIDEHWDDADCDGKGTLFSLAAGLYWYCADYHGGMASEEYAVLSALDYSPGASETCPTEEGDIYVYEQLGGELPVKVELHYTDDVWDEVGALYDSWEEAEKAAARGERVDQMCVVYCSGVDGERDQSVEGSTWEKLEDGTCYTVLPDYDGTLADRLRAQGYIVHERPDTYPIDRG